MCVSAVQLKIKSISETELLEITFSHYKDWIKGLEYICQMLYHCPLFLASKFSSKHLYFCQTKHDILPLKHILSLTSIWIYDELYWKSGLSFIATWYLYFTINTFYWISYNLAMHMHVYNGILFSCEKNEIMLLLLCWWIWEYYAE